MQVFPRQKSFCLERVAISSECLSTDWSILCLIISSFFSRLWGSEAVLLFLVTQRICVWDLVNHRVWDGSLGTLSTAPLWLRRQVVRLVRRWVLCIKTLPLLVKGDLIQLPWKFQHLVPACDPVNSLLFHRDLPIFVVSVYFGFKDDLYSCWVSSDGVFVVFSG